MLLLFTIANGHVRPLTGALTAVDPLGVMLAMHRPGGDIMLRCLLPSHRVRTRTRAVKNNPHH